MSARKSLDEEQKCTGRTLIRRSLTKSSQEIAKAWTCKVEIKGWTCGRSERDSKRINKIKQLKTQERWVSKGKETNEFLVWMDRKSVAMLPKKSKLKTWGNKTAPVSWIVGKQWCDWSCEMPVLGPTSRVDGWLIKQQFALLFPPSSLSLWLPSLSSVYRHNK